MGSNPFKEQHRQFLLSEQWRLLDNGILPPTCHIHSAAIIFSSHGGTSQICNTNTLVVRSTVWVTWCLPSLWQRWLSFFEMDNSLVSFFFIFLLFYLSMIGRKLVDDVTDRIRRVDLWCWETPVYQLTHHHCQKLTVFAMAMGFYGY